MKLKNLLLISGGAAVGYVFGARAGRARFEELKARATDIVHNPKVQEGVSTVASRISENADKIPGPASGIVKGAAEQVKSAVDQANGAAQASGGGQPTGVGKPTGVDPLAGVDPVTGADPLTGVDPVTGADLANGVYPQTDSPRRADETGL